MFEQSVLPDLRCCCRLRDEHQQIIAQDEPLQALLFGVTPSDPLTTSIAASALLVIGMVAGYWPARRAMNTDPMIALRAE